MGQCTTIIPIRRRENLGGYDWRKIGGHPKQPFAYFGEISCHKVWRKIP
jgi:hypothetical protein